MHRHMREASERVGGKEGRKRSAEDRGEPVNGRTV